MDKPTVFSKQWFGKHQKTLLFLLNNRLIKPIFRRIMRIDLKDNILAILPNAIFIKGSKKNEYVAEFETDDNFYGKKLYYTFKPIWYIIHIWDTLFANRYNKVLNFGFDTLTVYQGTVGGSTGVRTIISGQLGVGDTFANLVSGITTSVAPDDSFNCIISADSATNKWQKMTRAFCHFNTSALTSASIISSADLRVYSYLSPNNISGFSALYLVSSSANDTSLSASNWSSVGSISFGTITPNTSANYHTYSLNASGLSNISKIGYSKFAFRHNWDFNNTAPTWSWASTSVEISDSTDNNYRPRLTITYTLVTFIPQILFL